MNDALMHVISFIPHALPQQLSAKWLMASAVQPSWMKVLYSLYLAFWIRWYFRHLMQLGGYKIHQGMGLKGFYLLCLGALMAFGAFLANRFGSVAFVKGLSELVYSSHAFTVYLAFAIAFSLYRFVQPVHSLRLGPRHVWGIFFILFFISDALGPRMSLMILSQMISDFTMGLLILQTQI